MMSIANIPLEVLVNILSNIWNAIGMPLILGGVAAGITQKLKLNPNIPYIAEGETWVVRGFVAISCLILQLIFMVIHRDVIGWNIVGEMFKSYFAASVMYTHLFKVLPASTTTVPTENVQ